MLENYLKMSLTCLINSVCLPQTLYLKAIFHLFFLFYTFSKLGIITDILDWTIKKTNHHLSSTTHFQFDLTLYLFHSSSTILNKSIKNTLKKISIPFLFLVWICWIIIFFCRKEWNNINKLVIFAMNKGWNLNLV